MRKYAPHLAAFKDHVDTVKALLTSGASVNKPENGRMFLLQIATLNGYIKYS